MYSALRQTVFAALLLNAVTGCGQMGPLYLPEAPAAEADGPATEDAQTATEDTATAAEAAKPKDDEG